MATSYQRANFLVQADSACEQLIPEMTSPVPGSDVTRYAADLSLLSSHLVPYTSTAHPPPHRGSVCVCRNVGQGVNSKQ